MDSLHYQSRICPYFVIMAENLNITLGTELESILLKRDAYYFVIGSNIENLGYFNSVLNIVSVEILSENLYLFQRKTLCNENEMTWNILKDGQLLYNNKLFNPYPSISCMHLKAGSFEYPPWIFIDNTKQGNDRFQGAEVIIFAITINRYLIEIFSSLIWSRQWHKS